MLSKGKIVGVQGIRERSESVGGHLKVWSEKNAGTEIELHIAARVAYAKPRIPAFISRRRQFFSRR
jgi:signal transduction histidine kinase